MTYRCPRCSRDWPMAGNCPECARARCYVSVRPVASHAPRLGRLCVCHGVTPERCMALRQELRSQPARTSRPERSRVLSVRGDCLARAFALASIVYGGGWKRDLRAVAVGR